MHLTASVGPFCSLYCNSVGVCGKSEHKRNNVLFFIGFCSFFPRWLLVHHFHCEQVAKTTATHLPKIIYQAYLHSENSITVAIQRSHNAMCVFRLILLHPNDVCIPVQLWHRSISIIKFWHNFSHIFFFLWCITCPL